MRDIELEKKRERSMEKWKYRMDRRKGVSWAYLKGWGPVQLGRVYCVRWDICDVWYELLQEVAALLQVGGVYDHLHQLEANTWHKDASLKRHKSNTPLNIVLCQRHLGIMFTLSLLYLISHYFYQTRKRFFSLNWYKYILHLFIHSFILLW